MEHETCSQHRTMVEDVKEIKKKLEGNGRAGILERLSRLETKVSIIMWLNVIMAGTLVTGLMKMIVTL